MAQICSSNGSSNSVVGFIGSGIKVMEIYRPKIYGLQMTRNWVSSVYFTKKKIQMTSRDF